MVTAQIYWLTLMFPFLIQGCDPIVDGTDPYTYMDKTKLKIDGVELQNNGSYTCTLTFTLGGVTGNVSETIDAWVRG